MSIVTSDEAVLGGEPRIRGTRIGVRHVVELIRDGGLDIATAADQLGVDNASVQHCVEYYDAHREEMATWDDREADRVASARAASRGGER